MLASVALLVLPLLAPLAAAVPSEEANAYHLEARATHSKTGWYSYGCYFDCYDGMNRYLPYKAYADAGNNPDKCTAACAAAGYAYAGLQFGQECWCGNDGGEGLGQTTSSKDCGMRCKNGASCGGGCRNNIWGKEKPSNNGNGNGNGNGKDHNKGNGHGHGHGH